MEHCEEAKYWGQKIQTLFFLWIARLSGTLPGWCAKKNCSSEYVCEIETTDHAGSLRAASTHKKIRSPCSHFCSVVNDNHNTSPTSFHTVFVCVGVETTRWNKVLPLLNNVVPERIKYQTNSTVSQDTCLVRLKNNTSYRIHYMLQGHCNFGRPVKSMSSNSNQCRKPTYGCKTGTKVRVGEGAHFILLCGLHRVSHTPICSHLWKLERHQR